MKSPNRRHMGQSPLGQKHHDILSAEPRVPEQNLTHFLQAGPASLQDPLSLLFPETPLPSSSLLQQVTLQPKDETPPAPILVGPECRLSQSVLWDIQTAYYTNAGANAWQQDVPCFITSSAYMAESYAELILAFLEDYYPALNRSEPVYIVELAAGAGRLSHLLLRELEKKKTYFSKLQDVQLKYIMTDFAERNLAFWENHEKLQPFVESGALDFALFNPMAETSLTLRRSRQVISAGSMANPMITLANYFFDTIRQDVFKVENKHLHEGLARITLKDPQKAGPGLPGINDIDLKYRYRELRNENYYPDPKLNQILRYYKHHIQSGSIIFPIGGFEAIHNLEILSGNQLVLISSDKSYVDYHNMSLRKRHNFAIHGGAFSYMVNYDAIGRYFEQDGGQWMATSSDYWGLATVCCLKLSRKQHRLERLRYTFEEKVDRINPINSLCAMYKNFEQIQEVEKISYYLGYLRLNLTDPQILGFITNNITMLLPHIQESQREELLHLMDMAWERFYYYPGEINVPFCMAQLYFVLGMNEKSIFCLDETIRYYGAHDTLLYLKGQNYENMGKPEQARIWYLEALALNPQQDLSRSRLEILQNAT